jgi:xylulokinase
MRDAAVGIDIGTTSIKAIVVDSEARILFENSIPHELISERSGFAEEDAEEWWQHVKRLLTAIAREVDVTRIAGLGFCGMVPTLILLDDNGVPLGRSLQQNDARAVREMDAWRRKLDADSYFARTGNTINQQLIFPKYEWLAARDPEISEKTRTILGSYNYITYRATGELTLEKNWALESGMWRIDREEWDEEILSGSGIQRECLPPVYESQNIVGYTTPELESQTGFPPGIPVIAGAADHVASALATGVQEDGDLLLKLGGAGDILFATEELRTDRRLFIDYHPIPGRYLINGCMASSGSVVKWLMAQLGLNDFDKVSAKASALPPGSEGLVLLPYFLGEKTPIFDTNARGVFFGLSLSHRSEHLFRAALEAVAFGFRHHVDVLAEMKADVKRVYLSNGGAKSELWKKIVVDVIGKPAEYVPSNPGSCLGVALITMEATGLSQGWATLDKVLATRRRIEFSQESHDLYEPFYDIYRKLYRQLKPLFEQLARTSAQAE